MNKPTPGPWDTDRWWIRTRDWEILIPAIDRDTATADAALIVAAVNACFAVNPDNPLAVAEALPELVEACRESSECLHDLSGNGVAHVQIGPPWAMLVVALAKLERKEK